MFEKDSFSLTLNTVAKKHCFHGVFPLLFLSFQFWHSEIGDDSLLTLATSLFHFSRFFFFICLSGFHDCHSNDNLSVVSFEPL